MTRKQILAGTVASMVMLQPAFGQDARVADLERRISELENQPQLSFGSVGTEVSIYGFVRAEAFYDSDFQQGDLTRTGRIGKPAFATDGAFDTSVRTSRFGIRTSTDTDIGVVGTQLEFDLFGSGGDDSGSPNLRLRHANVTIGDTWLFGQFWTNFMPLSHYPRTSDFNGPVGITFARVPQIRYSGGLGDFAYSLSLEESNGTSSDPVFTAAAAYAADRWSARVAGLAGRTESGGTSFDTNGLTLSGSFEPWEGGGLTATYVTGDGIGAYLIGGGDEIVGGTVNSANGYTLEFRQQMGERWNFGVAYGREDYDLASSTGTLDFTELETVHVNAFYQPTDRMTLGLEYIRGERTTSGGATFDADRIGTSVTFSF